MDRSGALLPLPTSGRHGRRRSQRVVTRRVRHRFPMQSRQRCDQIGEALALDDHVFAHSLCTQIGVPADDRLNDAFMLVKRRG
jgi:hypothetical protein